MPELLIELLSEEIPARMQARAAEDFRRLVCERLERAQLAYAEARAYVTPRRLALVVEGLPERQPEVREERKGPRVGSPQKAVDGFVRAAGLAAIDQAEIRDTDKGQFYFAVSKRAGEPTSTVAAAVLGEVLAALPWPKSMRWGSGTVRWVRPLHNILAIFDGTPLSFSFTLAPGTTLTANARTCGHRFLAPAWFEVRDFADYLAKLRAAKVMLDPAERRALIAAEAERLATGEGLRLRPDEALLDEVTGLVEWPIPMLGRIDEAFMGVPREVLVTAMRAHQKYFALETADGALAPRFVVVANTEATDGGVAIVAGNERVLRARLSDAKFFWDEDRKRTLESRVAKLSERVFHAKLGSDLRRTARLQALAAGIAPLVGAEPEPAKRAAMLCKADLTSLMVGEFPELQGVMGRYYTLNDHEPSAVADAIADHYAPQGPSDRCPKAPVSVAVALADKIDTLAGFFAIGEKPTGSRDPFALRRAALGVIRLIIENRLRLNLRRAFAAAFDGYLSADGSDDAVRTLLGGVDRAALVDDLLAFFADRLKVHLREQGVRHDLIAAVFAGGAEDDLVRLLSKVDALRDFLTTDDGANLLTAYRRASNIVRIEENKDAQRYDGEVEAALLADDNEKNLHRKLAEAHPRIKAAVDNEDFREAMRVLAGLRAPVDAFFDHVTVNCTEPALRANRLRLLAQIRLALGEVADFSQIEG